VKRKLENGLTYYLYNVKEKDEMVYISLALNIGSIVEDKNKRGLAHFVEHMCLGFDLEVLQLKRVYSDVFGRTDFNETVFVLKSDTYNIFNCLKLLKEIILGNTLKYENLDKVKKDVLKEYNLQKNKFDFRNNLFKNMLAETERFGEIPIGNEFDIINFKYEDVIGFFSKWYNINNMSIIIVGDFDVLMIEKFIRKEFLYIKNSSIINQVKRNNLYIQNINKVNEPECDIYCNSDRNIIYKYFFNEKKEKDIYEIYRSKLLSDICMSLLEKYFYKILYLNNCNFQDIFILNSDIGIYLEYYLIFVSCYSKRDMHNCKSTLDRVFNQLDNIVFSDDIIRDEIKMYIAKINYNYYKSSQNIDLLSILDQLILSFIKNTPFMDLNKEYDFIIKILENVLPLDVNEHLQLLYKS
jgi:zinc protease